MPRLVPAIAFALALSLALAACRACKSDHPFVPYRIDGDAAALPSVTPSGEAGHGTAQNDASAFQREPAAAAPPHASEWRLGGLDLVAPAGSIFRQGLVWDLDGDGVDDALTLVETVDETVHESLVFYRGDRGVSPSPMPVSLRSVSGADPNAERTIDPRCKRIEHLTRVGRRSAAVELGSECAQDTAALEEGRTVALVAWSGSLRTRLAFDVQDPRDAKTLTFELDGKDIDGDGLDDVTLRVTLAGGGAPFEPGPPVHAIFRWLDRSAGMSREPGEPESSFHAIATLALQHAAKAKEAATGLALAEAGRFMFQAICAESPARRVTPGSGSDPFSCDAGRALEELGLAATRAYVSEGDALRAITALEDAELAPSARTPARVNEANGWIAALAPVVQATSVRAIGAVPRLGASPVSWGALRFDGAGNLLVRTPAGVVRVDPVHGDETDAPNVASWESTVVSPDGTVRLEGAFVPCRGVALEASLSVDRKSDPVSVALPIARPVGARCPSGGREPVPALPIAWGIGGLELVVMGEPVLIHPDNATASALLQLLKQPVSPGAPRSPDGERLVVPTAPRTPRPGRRQSTLSRKRAGSWLRRAS